MGDPVPGGLGGKLRLGRLGPGYRSFRICPKLSLRSVIDGDSPRANRLDTLVTSDTVAASRPAPYLVFHAMEATGVTDVRRVLTAGDTPNDLAAGMNAGAGFVVGVTTGSFTRSQLEAEPHTHILGTVAALPTLL